MIFGCFFWQIFVCVGNIRDDATISTPHRECDKICNYPERYINENLPMKQETKNLSFLFKSKHQNLNGLDVYHLYAA